MKRCSRCKKEKQFTMPYCKTKSGVYYMCRECNTARSKKYRGTDNGRANVNKAVYKSIKKHLEKQNARIKLRYHVKNGNIIKPKRCQKCDQKVRVEGHHEDYSKPLHVVWVCRTCHIELDKKLLAKQK